MMESEEAGATAGQENPEDPEMKKKKLEAVLGKVNDALGRFCNTSFLLASTGLYQASVLTSAVKKSQQHQEKFLGTPRIEPGAAGRESSMPLCAMLNAMTKQSFNPT